MRTLFSILLTLSCITICAPLIASSPDDDNVAVASAAPLVATAPLVFGAPDLNDTEKFSRLPTFVLRQIGDILLENKPQSFGRFLTVSRTTYALKDTIYHPIPKMGTEVVGGKLRTVITYGGANNTKDRVLELLGRQTRNPELFKKDHAQDYQGWSKEDLLMLLNNRVLINTLNPNKALGRAYFDLKVLLQDTTITDLTDGVERLCPIFQEATHLENIFLSCKILTTVPSVHTLTNLRCLDLANNQLIAVPGLSALTNLEVLNLKCNRLAKIPGLDALTNLRDLILDYNQLTRISEIGALTNLRCLDLEHNQLTEVQGLKFLTNLRRLELSYNQLSKASDLDALTNLKQLNLYKNCFTTIPELEALENLEELNISRNQLTSLPELSALTNLEELKISENQLASISGLNALTNLEHLDLSQNQFTNLPGLNALTNLKVLTLDGNGLVTPLRFDAMKKLRRLYLDGNQTNQVGILRSIVALIDLQQARHSTVVDVHKNGYQIYEETLRERLAKLSGEGQTQVEQ